MTESEKIITALSRDFHQLRQLMIGNGTKKGSVLGRLEDIEKIVDRIEKKPERECIFLKYKEQQKENIIRKKSFRIGDIANIIQLAMLFLIIYEMFIKGG